MNGVKSKDILAKLNKPTDRERFSIYVSEKIWDDFSALCGKKRSAVLELLMQKFIKNAAKKS